MPRQVKTKVYTYHLRKNFGYRVIEDRQKPEKLDINKNILKDTSFEKIANTQRQSVGQMA